ncbi:TPA: hypothetical protein ACH3X1_007229 [Trebouxia sp. C0004]
MSVMKTLRSCKSSLIARDSLGTFRSTSYFPSSPLIPLGAAKASVNPRASERQANYSRQQLNHCRSSRILGRTAASIPHTSDSLAMPTSQDHSSFANYLQAAVTHIDLDLSVHFDSKTVGGTAEVHSNSRNCIVCVCMHHLN